MNVPACIEAVQRAVGVTPDRKPGPKTWAAIYSRLVGKEWVDPVVVGEVDARSEAAIKTLLPEVQPSVRAQILACADQGIIIVVTSGNRTCKEQNDLFEQGRSKPGKIVTNARCGFSHHNFGLAWDITIFENGKPVWESPLYKVVGAIGKSLGLSWGGDWHSIVDEPHFYKLPFWAEGMKETTLLVELRTRQEDGRSMFL